MLIKVKIEELKKCDTKSLLLKICMICIMKKVKVRCNLRRVRKIKIKTKATYEIWYEMEQINEN